MNERVQNVVGIVIAVCSVVATSAFVWSRLSGHPSAAALLSVRAVEHASDYARTGMHEGGPGSVQLVVFGDYQCPGCRQLQGAIDSVLARKDAAFQVIYHYYPLTRIHPYAYAAALAAACAGDQGRFAIIHRMLFSRQDSLGRLSWEELALRAGVPDAKTFHTCLRDSVEAKQVAADVALGHRLAIIATPSFIVGDSLYTGGRSASQLFSMVQSARTRIPAR